MVGAFQKGQGVRFTLQVGAWLIYFPVLINNCIINNRKLLRRLLKNTYWVSKIVIPWYDNTASLYLIY